MSRRRNLHRRAMHQEIRAGLIKEGVTVDQWRASLSIHTKGKRPDRQPPAKGKPGCRMGYRAKRRLRHA